MTPSRLQPTVAASSVLGNLARSERKICDGLFDFSCAEDLFFSMHLPESQQFNDKVEVQRQTTLSDFQQHQQENNWVTLA